VFLCEVCIFIFVFIVDINAKDRYFSFGILKVLTSCAFLSRSDRHDSHNHSLPHKQFILPCAIQIPCKIVFCIESVKSPGIFDILQICLSDLQPFCGWVAQKTLPAVSFFTLCASSASVPLLTCCAKVSMQLSLSPSPMYCLSKFRFFLLLCEVVVPRLFLVEGAAKVGKWGESNIGLWAQFNSILFLLL